MLTPILSQAELKILDDWADMGVKYAKKRIVLPPDMENDLERWPLQRWAFTLGFEAALYRDPTPETCAIITSSKSATA